MYFPYLRGRQYELLALREMVEKSLLSDRVVPIIEPVTLSSALTRTLNLFLEARHYLGLVRNPRVGRFEKDLADKKSQEDIQAIDTLLYDSSFLSLMYVDKDISTRCSALEGRGITKSEMATIITSEDAIKCMAKCFRSEHPRFYFVPDQGTFRRQVRNQKVLFEDHFSKRNRNADYADSVDESFSSDHLYYREDGYVGFSDFSVIGHDYSEAGFAPLAVAIHIVYFDDEDSLRVHHFVSETNDDIRDTAGKFGEAVSKLAKWNSTRKLDTYGVRAFEEMYRNDAYPGLGTVKKLSIMHHLELMGQYLDGVMAE